MSRSLLLFAAVSAGRVTQRDEAQLGLLPTLLQAADAFQVPVQLSRGAASAAPRSRVTPAGMSLAVETRDSAPWTLRRSVVKYDTARVVPAEVVEAAVAAATLAPCHFLTEPWRFYDAGPQTKVQLMMLNLKKLSKVGVPGWMVVTVAASEYAEDGSLSTEKGLEDHAAAACAVQNFMLALAAEGVGSKWMTGALGVDPQAILDVVGADAERERFLGVIWYGYPAKSLEETAAPRRKRGMEVYSRLP